MILGPDTRIGQDIIKKINEHFHFLKIAIPTGIYKEPIVLPPYQIALNLNNTEQLVSNFQLTEVVVSCSPQYSTETVKTAASKASAKFVNACYSYPQAVIEAACYRLPFQPTVMDATQSAAGCSLTDLWNVSHQMTLLPRPYVSDGRWLIDQGTVSLEEISVAHCFQFTSRIWAVLFWLLSMILRVIFPIIHDKKPYMSTSSWKFSGRSIEHHQEYKFKAVAECVDAELIRPDLALRKVLDALGISRSESHDWGCCSRIKVKLTEYKAVE